MRPSQGFWGTGEQGHLFQGNREQRLNFEGNRGTKTILGNREHRKQFSIFGEQGNKPIYFSRTREQVHPPPPWEGLRNMHLILGIPVFKVFIWGGIASDIRSEI